MSITQNITAAHKWFIGEDKILEFEPLADDGKLPTDPTKGVEDVSGRTFAYWLAKSETAVEPFFEKRTGGQGITITGVYNADRSVNTQRIAVAIEDTDTDDLKAGTWYHALKQIVAGGDAIYVDGTVILQKAPAPPE